MTEQELSPGESLGSVLRIVTDLQATARTHAEMQIQLASDVLRLLSVTRDLAEHVSALAEALAAALGSPQDEAPPPEPQEPPPPGVRLGSAVLHAGPDGTIHVQRAASPEEGAPGGLS